MSLLREVLDELRGMFAADLGLACATVVWIVVCAALARTAALPALGIGALLLAGALVLLVASVLRAARRARSAPPAR